MTECLKCMFDTVAFNRIVEDEVPVEQLIPFVEAFATPIQWHELKRTKKTNPTKWDKLRRLFQTLLGEETPSGDSRLIPTATTAWGHSPWGSGKWSKKDNLYGPILTTMNERERHKNNPRDALIAETAIKKDLILVTDDKGLREVARRFGATCKSWEQLREHCGI